jgi:hypothetical protein
MITYDAIRAGDRVTFQSYNGLRLERGRTVPEFKPRTGRAVMRGPAGWVLNMGGPHGRPAVCGPDAFIRATRPRTM